MITYDLPPEFLRSQLELNAETGELFWKAPASGRTVGKRAGSMRPDGYWTVGIKNERYHLHRVVYAIHHGVLPPGYIDHINGNPSDNRVANLRVVSARENHQNRVNHRAGKLVGAIHTKSTGRWQARISVEGRPIQLGTFATEQEAHEAYLAAAATLKANNL